MFYLNNFGKHEHIVFLSVGLITWL